MCGRCDKKIEGTEEISISLVMPHEQAHALLLDFRDKKVSGEPSALAINVMHVNMIATSGELPPPIEGQGTRLAMAVVNSRPPRPFWWPTVLIAILLVALMWYAALSLVTPTVALNTVYGVLLLVSARYAFRIGRRGVRLRRRT